MQYAQMLWSDLLLIGEEEFREQPYGQATRVQ